MTTPMPSAEAEYNLIERLKAIAAILRRPETSVLDRYAGISELALFRDIRKVHVLTFGLMDVNPQVRALAAAVLDNSYGLRETSQAVLGLLENGHEGLRAAFYDTEGGGFGALLAKLGRPLREPRRQDVDGEFVDYDRRHVLAILSGLGRWFRQTQAIYGAWQSRRPSGAETSDQGEDRHPLKILLEGDQYRWILPLIRASLDSTDVFCRREAILVVGELNLDFDFDESAFSLIQRLVDREDNREDYLVTWDGIKAMAAVVEQNPKLESRFNATLLDFFRKREYQLDDFRQRTATSYFTRGHCVDALAQRRDYDALKALISEGVRHRVLNMMQSDPAGWASARAKVRIVEAFAQIYRHEQSEDGQLTPRQIEILDSVVEWVGSRVRDVRSAALSFLVEVPDPSLALPHLITTTLDNNAALEQAVAQWQEAGRPAGKHPRFRAVEELLTDRWEFIDLLGAMFTRRAPSQVARALRREVVALLKRWAFERILDASGAELPRSVAGRAEALWTLYSIGVERASLAADEVAEVTLTLEEVQQLQESDSGVLFRRISELFRARLKGDNFEAELLLIATGQDHELVRATARVEALIQTSAVGLDLTDDEVRVIAARWTERGGIHPRQAQRLVPVLARMETPAAARLTKRLLSPKPHEEEPRLRQAMRVALRAALSDFQSYALRNDFLAMLLQDLRRHHLDPVRLRLDYRNLHHAGLYQRRAAASAELRFPQSSADPFKERLISGIRRLLKEFEELEVPVLWGDAATRIVGLPGLSPQYVPTVLYAAEAANAEVQQTRLYLHRPKFEGHLVFLDRSLPDREIARLVQERAGSRPVPVAHGQWRLNSVERRIVGRVERIDPTGVVVDVGLRDVRPVVDRAGMAGRVDAPPTDEEWQVMAADWLGALLSFRLERVTLTEREGGEIVEMVLSRVEGALESFAGAAGEPVEASIERVASQDPDNLGVRFSVGDRPAFVPLRELSWRSSVSWIQHGWRSWFEERVGQSMPLVYEEGEWSVRRSAPQLELFAQLLYERGTDEFELVYAGQDRQGYWFEIEPGTNCYVEAERLVRLDGETGALDFRLPGTALEPGDTLTVRFVEMAINGELEVVLEVVRETSNLMSHGTIRPGTRVVGELIELNAEERSGLVRAADPDLSGFVITIAGLPHPDMSADIRVGDDVSGLINTVDLYRLRLDLVYALARPDELEPDDFYQCSVSRDPRADDLFLWLRYANVTGIVYEDALTYSHQPVLWTFHRNQKIRARVEAKGWKERYNGRVVPHRGEQMLARLGLDGEKRTVQGYIVYSHNGRVLVERADEDSGQAGGFEFWVGDFDFVGSRPEFVVGNRIRFTRVAPPQISLMIESAEIRFACRPRPDRPGEWGSAEELLPPGRPQRCTYVSKQGHAYLLEVTPGVGLRLSLHSLPPETPRFTNGSVAWTLTANETVRRYPLDGGEPRTFRLVPGDAVTLLRTDSGIHLVEHLPGPLHLAARPDVFGLAAAPFPITGRVLPLVSERGKSVELIEVHGPAGRIQLRRRIRGFYPHDRMTVADRERALAGTLRKGDEVQVMLRRVPWLERGELRLDYLHGVEPEEEAPPEMEPEPAPEQEPIEEVLMRLAEAVAQQPDTLFDGTIRGYDRKRQAFVVTLDWLRDYEQYDCWLPGDRVTYSLVRPYQSAADFGDSRNRAFTILSVDLQAARVTVSLTDNPPLELHEAGALRGWQEGHVLSPTTFLGEMAAVPDAPSDDRLLGLEITPGLLVTLPVDRFFVDGLPYGRQRREFRLDRGDQLAVRVIEVQEHFALDVITAQQAEINLLTNTRRVLIGRVGRAIEGQQSVQLLGYEVDAFLDPEAAETSSDLGNVSLFRPRAARDGALFVEPVWPETLKPGDLLRVTFEGVDDAFPDRLHVTFGRGLHGYVRRTDISYRSDFTLADFRAQAGTRFDAAVRDTSDVQHILFSLKDVPPRRMSYFLDRQARERLGSGEFATVLVRHDERAQFIDLEVEPGSVVRVPYARLQPSAELPFSLADLPDEVVLGDILQVRLIVTARDDIRLVLVRRINSLFHYLKPNALVRSQLIERKGQRDWLFALPDYAPLVGKLTAPGQRPPDFLPGVFSRDWQLVVERIPRDPTHAIPLRQRTPTDPQQILRVESVGPDRLQVRREDGRLLSVFSRNATYRVDFRASYLRRVLRPGDTVIGMQRPGGGPNDYTLLENQPIPLPMLAGTLFETNGAGAILELTYVRTESDERVFEVRPGELVTLPTNSLFFDDQPLRDFRRFYPGDVLLVRLEQGREQGQEGWRVVVTNLSLSLLHSTLRNQLIEAEVVDVIPPAGIAIRAGRLEQFVPEMHLQRDKTANSFRTGDRLWLRVQSIDPWRATIELREVYASLLPPPAVARRTGLALPVLAYGRITRRWVQRIEIEVLGARLRLPASQLVWSPAPPEQLVVDDVLLPDEAGLWVGVFLDSTNNWMATPRPFGWVEVGRLLKPGEIVQAQVLQVNRDEVGQHSVLLSVDGVRTLVANTDLAVGAPAQAAVVEARQWVTVRIEEAEYQANDERRQCLVVSPRVLNAPLANMLAGKRFNARVHRLLPHGLVFSYEGAHGYIPNEHLAWVRQAAAEDLFEVGERITVHKIRDGWKLGSFSLKDLSDAEDLEEGEDVEATVARVTTDRVYIRASRLLAWLPRYWFQEQEMPARGDRLLLRLDHLDRQQLLVHFSPLHLAGRQVAAALASSDAVRQRLDAAYLTSVQRFLEALAAKQLDRMLDSEESSPSADAGTAAPLTPARMARALPEEIFARLLSSQQGRIPVTHANVRYLLGELAAAPGYRRLWVRLAKYEPKVDDDPMVYLMAQVARAIAGKELMGRDPGLEAMSSYAVGLAALVPDFGEAVARPEALAHLLNAYRREQAPDIQIAVLLLYAQLNRWDLCRQWLQRVVEGFAARVGNLLRLPRPVPLEEAGYSDVAARGLPGFNAPLPKVAERLDRARESLERGDVEQASASLKEMRDTARAAGLTMPEVDLNLALCHAVQGDHDVALGYLAHVAQALSRNRARGTFRLTNDAYYELALWIRYAMGRFSEMQKLVVEAIGRTSGSWLTTWLGYSFHRAGYLPLSREVTLAGGRPERCEHLLLQLYWQLDQSRPLDPEAQRLLRETVFRAPGVWNQPAFTVRLFPQLRTLDFKALLVAARQYDAPEYARHVHQTTPTYEPLLDDPEVAELLVDLYLLDARLGEAEKLVKAHLRRKERADEATQTRAAEFVARFYRRAGLERDLERLQQNLPGLNWPPARSHSDDVLIATLVERWLKSQATRPRAASRLARLLEGKIELKVNCWQRPAWRAHMWAALQGSLEYGALVDLMPQWWTWQALEQAVFRLAALGLHQTARAWVAAAREGGRWSDAENHYLAVLEQVVDLERDDDGTLRVLLAPPSGRDLAFYTSSAARRAALRALGILNQAPEVAGALHLLVGELQEVERQYAEATETYRTLVASSIPNDHGPGLVAALRLLYLRIYFPEIVATSSLPTEVAGWPLGRVRPGLAFDALARAGEQVGRVDRWRWAAVLGRAQLVVEALSRQGDDWLEQLETLLFRLHRLGSVAGGLAVPIFDAFVGAQPLVWMEPTITLHVLGLFLDYALANHDEVLKQRISAALEETRVSYDQLAERRRSREDEERGLSFRKGMAELVAVMFWRAPAALAQRPAAIEQCATAVQRFCSIGRQPGDELPLRAHRLSEEELLEATDELQRWMGPSSNAFGPAVHHLIASRALRQGCWQEARDAAQAVVIPRERDKLLLSLLFDRLSHNDLEAASELLAEISTHHNDQAGRLLREWQDPASTLGGEPDGPRSAAMRTAWLREWAPPATRYEYARHLTAALPPVRWSVELWQAHLESAMLADVAPPVVGTIITEMIGAGVVARSIVKPWVLVSYVARQTKSENQVLTAVLIDIARHGLCQVTEVVLAELALLNVMETSERVVA